MTYDLHWTLAPAFPVAAGYAVEHSLGYVGGRLSTLGTVVDSSDIAICYSDDEMTTWNFSHSFNLAGYGPNGIATRVNPLRWIGVTAIATVSILDSIDGFVGGGGVTGAGSLDWVFQDGKKFYMSDNLNLVTYDGSVINSLTVPPLPSGAPTLRLGDFGNGLYVIPMTNSSGPNQNLRSVDGVNFTIGGGQPTPIYFVKYGNGLFVGGPPVTLGQIPYTVDGIVWNLGNVLDGLFTHTLDDVIYTAGQWVASLDNGASVWLSDDGINWHRSAISMPRVGYRWTFVRGKQRLFAIGYSAAGSISAWALLPPSFPPPIVPGKMPDSYIPLSSGLNNWSRLIKA